MSYKVGNNIEPTDDSTHQFLSPSTTGMVSSRHMNNAIYTNTQQQQMWRIVPDLIRSRELLWDLVWKELRIRYRVAAMGFFWAVLHPLAMTLILTFVFTIIMGGTRPGIGTVQHPYAVILLCGLIPWNFFSSALNSATNALIDHRDLIKKVYFPRETIPLATILDWLVNLIIGFVLLLIVHKILGGVIGIHILWVLPIFAIQFAIILGFGLLFSCLNVFYRDMKYIVEVALMFGFYATPIFYPLAWAQERFALMHWPALEARFPGIDVGAWLYKIYMCNPMAGLITAYRQAILDNQAPDLTLLVWPILVAVISVWAGIWIFRKRAPLFADFL